MITYIHRWGNHSSITLLQNPRCTYFVHDALDGAIGYHQDSHCLIAIGDPLAHESNYQALIDAFQAFARAESKQALFFNVSHEMATLCQKKGMACIGIGEELIINPLIDWRKQQGYHASMRRQKYRRAQKDGLTFHEYTSHDPALEQRFENLGTLWLSQRKGLQASFYPLNIFGNREEKRWFYALHEGNLVGLLFMNRLYAVQGWVLNMMLLMPDAPATTSEFLVLSVLDALAAERCDYFSIGTTIGNELGMIHGFNPAVIWLAKKSYLLSNKLCKLSERQRYWKKFNPQRKPVYLICPRGTLGFYEARAIGRMMRTF